ncbi:MAG: NAD(P)/FAD-dependent oxidoreductase [Desulfovibrionaceae bacterium]|nr:NAD(P)/FAD-dependent oxidoreductase [Desulfovibrionaceae bacterium]MBF0512804.1 NAD(P)/FAD-dependent oxidoreductase [Desulfovibrionaceae bacterium]
MKYLIIGNGVASLGAIEGIRLTDQDGAITVVSDEPVPTYGRPLISYLLAGKIGKDRLALRDEAFYAANKVELKLNAKVAAIDVKARTATTGAGEILPYDRLLIATGGVPFRPPMAGLEGEGVYSFTTFAHAEALAEAAAEVKKAVVVGGGLIGLKAAESLFDRGVAVSIVELAPRVLSAAFDDKAGAIVSERLGKIGLKVFCNVSAKEIRRENGKIKGVLLSDGTFLEADIVVVAIGVVPACALAKDAGVTVDRGILVDEHLAASEAGVYAAGDVAQAPDMLTEGARVVPIWPNAYNQGYYAGKNMAGDAASYRGGLAMNAISFYGLATTSVGLVNPPADDPRFEVCDIVNAEAGTYRKLVFQDDRLVGCVLLGDIDGAGLYTGFIRFKFPLDAEAKQKLIDGAPSILMWPENFFDANWNPVGAKETV